MGCKSGDRGGRRSVLTDPASRNALVILDVWTRERSIMRTREKVDGSFFNRETKELEFIRLPFFKKCRYRCPSPEIPHKAKSFSGFFQTFLVYLEWLRGVPRGWRTSHPPVEALVLKKTSSTKTTSFQNEALFLIILLHQATRPHLISSVSARTRDETHAGRPESRIILRIVLADRCSRGRPDLILT